jgi:site-specific DNA-cytosine methylase
MLSSRELARGMGFPPDYVLKGTRADRVKQVGNAVEVTVARALCAAMLAA